MRVKRHLVLGQSAHFGSVHFVSVDEVAEESGIGVGEVERFVHNKVRIVAQDGVEGVILQMSRVQMFASVLIAPVVSNDAFKVVHGKEVGVVPTGSLKSH